VAGTPSGVPLRLPFSFSFCRWYGCGNSVIPNSDHTPWPDRLLLLHAIISSRLGGFGRGGINAMPFFISLLRLSPSISLSTCGVPTPEGSVVVQFTLDDEGPSLACKYERVSPSVNSRFVVWGEQMHRAYGYRGLISLRFFDFNDFFIV